MWKAAAAGAAAVAGVLAAGLLPAQAASGPGWQLTLKVGGSTAVTHPDGLVATSRHDAWSLWQACTTGCDRAGTAVLEHWNGTTWSRRRPAGLQKLRAPVAVGASSYRDVWVFGGQYGSRDKSTAALHFNGHAWSRHSVPSWVIRRNDGGDQRASAAAFGPRDVWVFSMAGGLGRGLAGRYNGHRWVRVRMPFTPFEVSAVSRSDIWALAPGGSGSELMHWNGRNWSSRNVPLTLSSGKIRSTASLTATGPRSAWMLADVAGPGSAPDTGSLLHWNGKSWRSSTVPGTDLSYLAPDGHGGWWTTSSPVTSDRRLGFFLHRNNGRWTRHAVPVQQRAAFEDFADLRRVPGTTSVLAAGQLTVNNSLGNSVSQPGAIWLYRR
jgi:hypothetical protein